MKRKLIKQGANALTITLPKEWTVLHQLKAGEEVDASIEDGRLVLNTKATPMKTRTTVHLPADDTSIHRYLLANAYRRGYDEIEVTFEEQRQLADIQLFIQELLGVEITSQSEKKVVLRAVAVPDAAEYQTLFRRAFHILGTAFGYALEDMRAGKYEFGKVQILQTGELRISNFCKRVLQTGITTDKPRNYAHYVILTINDYLLSQLCYVYKLLQKAKDRKISITYLEQCKSFFANIEKTIFEGKQEDLAELLKHQKKLFQFKDQIVVSKAEFKTVQEISVLARLMTLYASPVAMLLFKY